MMPGFVGRWFGRWSEPVGGLQGPVAMVLKVLALLLRLAGQDVRTAYDGAAALTAAKEFRPDLVLLDIGMPGMDGYQVAQRLRKELNFRDQVLVALTGWGQEEDRRRSEEAGFDRHLVKPVETSVLMELLRELGRRS